VIKERQFVFKTRDHLAKNKIFLSVKIFVAIQKIVPGFSDLFLFEEILKRMSSVPFSY